MRITCTKRRPAPIINCLPLSSVLAKAWAIAGTVRICSGPWRIEEGWWADRPDIREYWDVELERGGVYRVFRGGATEWFVDARYEM